ncbi:MAG: MFS transporter, partial [Treponema sp.]|nr:MFS transporter [Treponema sp.]
MINLVFAYIVSFFAYGAVTPFLPLMVRDLGYSAFFVGLLLGVFEGAGIAGPFVVGFAADKTGNYKIPIILSCLVTAVSVIPLAVFVHPALSVIFIIFFAFSFRATSPLLDAAATIFLGASGNYGRLRAAGSLSFIAMVLFLQWSPFLRPDNAANISFWIALTSAASVVPVLFMRKTGGVENLPLKKPVENPPLKKPRERVSLIRERADKDGSRETRLSRPRWTPVFFGGLSVIFLCRLSMSAVYTFFPLYLTE